MLTRQASTPAPLSLIYHHNYLHHLHLHIQPDHRNHIHRKVEWYADETGFHPSAPFLPKSVEPNHPEVAAAVKAQLEFAASEDAVEVASGSASNRNEAYAAPLPLASYSG